MSENENEVMPTEATQNTENVTETPVVEKTKKTWLENVKRTICVIVGAIVTFFGLDTYYSTQVTKTKENVNKLNTYIVTAIDQMKSGDYVTAIETLTNAKATILEIKADVEDTIDETKNTIERVKEDYENLKIAIEMKDKDSIKEYALNITEKMIEVTPYDKLNDTQKKIYDMAKNILTKIEMNEDDETETNLLNEIETLNKEIEGAN